ncbi:MAG: hypothetical protein ABJ387_03645 [Balneola sp.]
MSAAEKHITEYTELDRLTNEVLDAEIKITAEHLAKISADAIRSEYPKPVVD